MPLSFIHPLFTAYPVLFYHVFFVVVLSKQILCLEHDSVMACGLTNSNE